MKFSTDANQDTANLRNILSAWNPAQYNPDIFEIINVLMCLCGKIRVLENEVAEYERYEVGEGND